MKEISKNKKICFVTNSYPKYLVGGAELQCYYLAKEFVNSGWEVHFISGYLGKRRKKFLIDGGIKIHKIRRRKYFTILNLFEIYKTLKSIDSDVYYFRGIKLEVMMGNFGAIANKIRILAISSDMSCEGNVFAQSLRESNRNILKKLVLSLIAKFNDMLYLYGLRNVGLIFAQTEFQKLLLKTNFDIKSFLVKNGHPIPFRLPTKDNPPTVLWIGSLKRLRQPEIFINLAKQCKDLDCKFIMAGWCSDEQYKHSLLRQMNGFQNIKYLGGISFEESNQLISKASVFVNTSKHEGFPNTFIQAWMRKTPTVSLNVDPDNIIKNFQLGFHSKIFEQLVKDVRLLIEDKDLRIKMGQKARKYAIEEHDINKIHENFLSILKTLYRTY